MMACRISPAVTDNSDLQCYRLCMSLMCILVRKNCYAKFTEEAVLESLDSGEDMVSLPDSEHAFGIYRFELTTVLP